MIKSNNLNLALIGYGYWGPKLARNINNIQGLSLYAVVDQSEAARKKVNQQYPETKTFADIQEVLQDKAVNAVVVATPVGTHYPFAKMALEAGKHVLVEKPLCSIAKEAEDLFATAHRLGLKLMVDHTYLYTDAVQKMKALVDEDEIGKITYIDSTRINLGLFQHDVNVLWDLAPHDISITSYLTGKMPKTVQAFGAAHAKASIENIAYLNLKYDNEIIAHFNCSWVSPVKIRHFIVGGDKKMVIFNDLEATEKIRIYDTGYQVANKDERNRLKVDYRIGDIHIPKLPTSEALHNMLVDFRSFVNEGKEPISNEMITKHVVAILEMAEQSLKANGQPIQLENA
ncbi:MAG: Gfo/Idh/MocA family oxidoreductase [Saprospiraceae bacterium]|nr:Gfo/Idh/MocA family oxidoreductase [Saprospiraceae bacterium]